MYLLSVCWVLDRMGYLAEDSGTQDLWIQELWHNMADASKNDKICKCVCLGGGCKKEGRTRIHLQVQKGTKKAYLGQETKKF